MLEYGRIQKSKFKGDKIMILEVLKYILVVLGIIAVGAFIIWGLVSLILVIIEPHSNASDNNQREPYQTYDRPITYEPQRYVSNEPEPYVPQEPFASEYVPENTEVKELDYQKAKEEEQALMGGSSFDQLSKEEEEFIREKQRNIEERLSAKAIKEVVEEDELNLDDIFIDEEEQVKPIVETTSDRPLDSTAQDDEKEDDIEALINKILEGDDDFDDEEEETALEEITSTKEEVVEEPVQVAEEVAEEVVEETPAIEQEEVQEIVASLSETEPELVEKVEEVIANPQDEEKVKELQEELARQKEEFEAKIAELEKAKQEEVLVDNSQNEQKLAELEEELAKERANSQKIAELEQLLADKENEKAALMQENARIAEEAKKAVKSGPSLSIEEYEQRLEILKERLKANERDFKVIKKEYLPLAKIKKTLEKDNKKLRRKEALVAKQKVVLYGVNNYVDIDEEKAKKLAEDLDLLEGLRLSVQHCEEVMKANAERYPILESSYNILIDTNTNLKADIEECNAKIAQLKAMQEQNTDGETDAE